MSDKIADIIETDWPSAKRGENMIGRPPQVGRRIDKRPIEIDVVQLIREDRDRKGW